MTGSSLQTDAFGWTRSGVITHCIAFEDEIAAFAGFSLPWVLKMRQSVGASRVSTIGTYVVVAIVFAAIHERVLFIVADVRRCIDGWHAGGAIDKVEIAKVPCAGLVAVARRTLLDAVPSSLRERHEAYGCSPCWS